MLLNVIHVLICINLSENKTQIKEKQNKKQS